MEPRLPLRSIAILAGGVLSWLYGGSTVLAANVDPGLPGPFAVATQETRRSARLDSPPRSRYAPLCITPRTCRMAHFR
jgi:hypothetical protein